MAPALRIRVRVRAALLAAIVCLLPVVVAAQDGDAQEPYRTPRSGQELHTRLFGRDVDVAVRDRRSVSALDAGASLSIPGPEDDTVVPYASFYFWRHPDDDHLFRAVVAGLSNDVYYARALAPENAIHGVLTLQSRTIPFDQSELVDGEDIAYEELTWGVVRPGVGLSYRRQVAPGEQDNMFEATLLAEPAFLYFHGGNDKADDYRVPRDTFEMRGHLRVKWDAMARNLLDLEHEGVALGMDAFAGRRTNWEDYGFPGENPASRSRKPWLVSIYGVGATGVPFVEDERHRLVATVQAGLGGDLDRFSAPRVGGGPVGTEYGSIGRPVFPGSSIEEFFPSHYAIATAEYRYELFFFTYLSLRASAAWLDRDRFRDGVVHRGDDVLVSVGPRVTTGFLFGTRLQLEYAYSPDLHRDGHAGGSEVMLEITKSFWNH
jgi:hypothetical protein